MRRKLKPLFLVTVEHTAFRTHAFISEDTVPVKTESYGRFADEETAVKQTLADWASAYPEFPVSKVTVEARS